MNSSDVLLFYARHGLFKPIRKSAFRKFRRRNAGRESVIVTKPGFKMKTIIGDVVDNMIYLNGVWEQGTSEIIRKLSKSCKAFVDVGCNIGYYSCLYSWFNPGGKVYAIDPNPEMIRRTRDNLELNSCRKYKLLNFGVSNTSEKLALNIARHKHSGSSLAYNPSRHSPDKVSQIEVQVKPLEEILSVELLECALLKVDTEGFEYNVFSGLDPDHGPIFDYIVFEYSSEALERAGVQPARLMKLKLFSHYLLYIINEDGSLIRRKREDIAHSGDMMVNCLLVRKDKVFCLDFVPQ
ncbi:MAG: FkbM family methyltransferase [Planctomycetota bacterium]|jgi:FkbM family methyltransferase